MGVFCPFWCGMMRRVAGHWLILDGVFLIARTGIPWRDLHEYLGKWSAVYRQSRRWTLASVWDVILETLNASGEGNDRVQMIDSTIVRAHQHSAGAKKGDSRKAMRERILTVLVVASRPRSNREPITWVYRSR